MISLLLTCSLSYYYFYISGILVVFYLIFRNVYQKNQLNMVIVQLVVLAVMAALVIGMVAFIVLPQLEIVRNSARTNVSDIRGWGNSLMHSWMFCRPPFCVCLGMTFWETRLWMIISEVQKIISRLRHIHPHYA